MRTLVHLSDLHFGRIDPQLLDPLARRLHALRADVVVVSGDLTQRAKTGQFEEAKRFLDSLPGPQIVVPGNHDVPLYNLPQRFLAPLGRFRRIITQDLEPEYVDAEIAVLGVNTARSLVFKGGRINAEQVARVRQKLCDLPRHVTKIVVTHHPFDLPEGGSARNIVGRARMAIEAFAGCGADLLLSGHMHATDARHAGERYGIGAGAPLVVQAGTATSTRGRGEANSFNVLRIAGGRVGIRPFAWDAGAADFLPAAEELYERGPAGWAPLASAL
jgi:3',5'-cyclic AMP phosphodiesterase CpdA